MVAFAIVGQPTMFDRFSPCSILKGKLHPSLRVSVPDSHPSARSARLTCLSFHSEIHNEINLKICKLQSKRLPSPRCISTICKRLLESGLIKEQCRRVCLYKDGRYKEAENPFQIGRAHV